MRLIFAGTPEFARVALAHLHAAGFKISLVLTQPDRPAGRGLRLQASPVKQWALEHGITVAQPRSLRLDGKYPDEAAAGHAAIRDAGADLMVVAAYGLLLPLSVLDMMAASGRLGCINIHASLLPRWRGAAPIHRAIEAGDVETGITTMQMDAGLDTGDMLLVESLPIAETDTTGTLHDRLAALGGRMVVETIRLATRGKLAPRAQPAEGVSYARKVDKHEALVDWTEPAQRIARRIRAFNPAPVCSTALGADPIKLLAAQALEHTPNLGDAASGEVAGQVVAADANGVVVATGDGLLCITQLQKAGGKPMAAADFLRGFPVQPGAVFARIA